MQEWLAEGRQEGRREGRQQEAVTVTRRQLTQRCGPLSEATSAGMAQLPLERLPLERLEALAEAPLDVRGGGEGLASWLAAER